LKGDKLRHLSHSGSFFETASLSQYIYHVFALCACDFSCRLRIGQGQNHRYVIRSPSYMHPELIILISILCACLENLRNYWNIFSTEVPVCEPNSNYTLPHFYYCDRYFSCVDGFVHEGQCADGYAYEHLAGCIYSHFVDCTSRPLFRK
jgi:hypothetical protein